MPPQSTFRARIGPVGHLRTQCNNLATTAIAASTIAPVPTAAPTTTTHILTNAVPNPRIPAPSITATPIISAKITAATTNTTTSTTPANDHNDLDVRPTANTFSITTSTSNDVGLVQTSPHLNRTST
nr:unnamed protein product [Spirometra erinaceieuropaei]